MSADPGDRPHPNPRSSTGGDEVPGGEEAEPDAIARLWQALREVEDPELPVSLVDMGLIVGVDYDPPSRAAALKITYTAMGCPAMEMIQDDIRARLLREPGVDAVTIEVVWDPAWT